MKSKTCIISLFFLLLGSVKAQELLNYPLDTVNGEEVYRYEVERSVGLYRISVNFNVSQSDIIRLNPQLNERGVHYKEVLLIPTGRLGLKESQPVVVETTVKETPVPVEPIVKETPAPVEVPAPAVQEPVDNAEQQPTANSQEQKAKGRKQKAQSDKTIELALLLPFESQQTKRSGNADRMREFYQGALLALNDLQDDSVQFRLRVYDIERSERRLNILCDSTELDNVQGIIGPLYPIQIERMASWCEEHQVPMLLPFSDDSELTKRPHILQFNSTDRQEADSLCQWIIAHDSLLHCVAVDVREADMSESVRTLREQMKADSIPCATIALRDLLNDSVEYALDSAKENLIILHSDKYQHVRILMPHLVKLQAKGYALRIVSQYSWIKEDITLPQIYTSMFTSEADRTAYDTLWRMYYTNEHVSDAPRFDLLGYDLTQALVAWLQGRKEVNGQQSLIRWKQDGEGGWQNEGVKVIEK